MKERERRESEKERGTEQCIIGRERESKRERRLERERESVCVR